MDESEDENGAYEDEKLYTRKGKERVEYGTQLLIFVFVDIKHLDVKVRMNEISTHEYRNRWGLIKLLQTEEGRKERRTRIG